MSSFLAIGLALIVLVGVGVVVALVVAGRAAKRSLDETPVIPRKASYYRVAKESDELIEQISGSLKTSGLPELRRDDMLAQMKLTRQNLASVLAQLDRLNTARLAAGKMSSAGATQTALADMQTMETDLVGQLNRIHDALLGAQVGLLKVDVARGGKPLDQMMSDLGEMNAQLADSASAYQDLQEGDLEREMRKNRMSN